ncbi:MAG: hypothetical protein IKH75_01040 [Ruminococcus sp.]|nr:hypothetical protein [Ruminococcus sp.]
MTEDTRRALEAIAPIAKELNISIRADRHFLYCNGQAIGIGCNSTYATINEFLAYCMVWLSRREYRFRNIPEGFESALKRYWHTDEQVAQITKYDKEEAKCS